MSSHRSSLEYDPILFDQWVEDHLDVRMRLGDERACVCPAHQSSDTNRPDLWVNVEKGVFHCLSTKCAIKGSAPRLVQLVTGVSIDQASRDLALDPTSQVVRILASLDPPPPPAPLSLSWTQVREKRSNRYWVKERQLSPPTCDHFHLGYDLELDEALIPYLNELGQPVCFIRRRMSSGSGRYLYPKGFSRETAIFHLSEIDLAREVVLCEGAVDAMRVYEAGYQNVVSTLGASITPRQMEKLAALKVISFLDHDDAGLVATRKLVAELPRICRIARYPRGSWGKDPGSLNDYEIRTAIDRAIPSTSWSLGLPS